MSPVPGLRERANDGLEDGYETDVSHAFQQMKYVEIVRPVQGLPPTRHLRWSAEQHTVLCLLMHLWEGIHDLVKIFNTIFMEKIKADGFPIGASPRSVRAQWASMKTEKSSQTGNRKFKEMGSYSETELRNNYATYIQLIEDTAKVRGISLKRRSGALQKPLRRSFGQRLRSISDISDSDDDIWTTRSSSSEAITRDKHPKLAPGSSRKWNGTVTRSLPSYGKYTENLIITSQNQAHLWTTLSNRPVSQLCQPGRSRRILFRAYDYNGISDPESQSDSSHVTNSPTGFRAGYFKDPSAEIIPPFIDPKIFKLSVVSHLSDDGRKEPTPFISLTDNPLPAIRRALRLAHGVVSVIDLETAINALKERFPGAETVHWIVTPLVGELNLQLRGGYGKRISTSEHLLWAEIDERAIITTFSAENIKNRKDLSELLHIDALQNSLCTTYFYRDLELRTMPQFKYGTGRTIGELIKLDTPRRWRDSELIAAKILMAWTPLQFRYYAWTKQRHASYAEFMNGVFSAIYAESEKILTYDQSWHEEEIYGRQLEDCITVETPKATNAQPMIGAGFDDEEYDQDQIDPLEGNDEVAEAGEICNSLGKENIPPETPTIYSDSIVDPEDLRAPKHNVHLDLGFRSPKHESSTTPKPLGVFQLKRKRSANPFQNWEHKDRDLSPTANRGPLLPLNGPLSKRVRTATPIFQDLGGRLLAELRAAAQDSTPMTISSSSSSSLIRLGQNASKPRERWHGSQASVIDLTGDDECSHSPSSDNDNLVTQSQRKGRNGMTDDVSQGAESWFRSKPPVWQATDVAGVMIYEPSNVQEVPNATQTTEASMRDVSKYFNGQMLPGATTNAEAFLAQGIINADDIMESIEFDDDNKGLENANRAFIAGQSQSQEQQQKVGWAAMRRGDGFDVTEKACCVKNGE